MKPALENLQTLHTGALGLRREFTFETRAVPDSDEPEIDYIASTPATDWHDESIDQEGWDFSVFRKNPVIVNCHNYFDVGFVLGRAPQVGVQSNALYDRVRFSLANPMGKIAYGMAREKMLPTQSVGFVPIEWKDANLPDQARRVFLKQTLLEISIVVIPANPEASNLALAKAVREGVVEKSDLRHCIEWLRKLCEDTRTPPLERAPGREIQSARSLLAEKLRRTALQIQINHARAILRA